MTNIIFKTVNFRKKLLSSNITQARTSDDLSKHDTTLDMYGSINQSVIVNNGIEI